MSETTNELEDSENVKAALNAAEERRRARRLFSDNAVVRQEAIEIIKNAWSYHEPSFNVEELSSMPTEACTIMAAKRDAYKEVVDWLIKL
jgi:hypothetical protein